MLSFWVARTKSTRRIFLNCPQLKVSREVNFTRQYRQHLPSKLTGQVPLSAATSSVQNTQLNTSTHPWTSQFSKKSVSIVGVTPEAKPNGKSFIVLENIYTVLYVLRWGYTCMLSHFPISHWVLLLVILRHINLLKNWKTCNVLMDFSVLSITWKFLLQSGTDQQERKIRSTGKKDEINMRERTLRRSLPESVN